MNTANLQLIGLNAAVAALIGALKRKGIVTGEEIEALLADVEDQTHRDGAARAGLSPSNVEAMCFPIRYLRTVNAAGDDVLHPPSFAKIAAQAGPDDHAGATARRERDGEAPGRETVS